MFCQRRTYVVAVQEQVWSRDRGEGFNVPGRIYRTQLQSQTMSSGGGREGGKDPDSFPCESLGRGRRRRSLISVVRISGRRHRRLNSALERGGGGGGGRFSVTLSRRLPRRRRGEGYSICHEGGCGGEDLPSLSVGGKFGFELPLLRDRVKYSALHKEEEDEATQQVE